MVTNIKKQCFVYNFFPFVHYTFQRWLHKRLKMTLNTSFMSATVTYYIGVLTQLQEKETKGPFMVHWHTRIGILISFPTEIALFCTIAVSWWNKLIMHRRHQTRSIVSLLHLCLRKTHHIHS